MANHNVSWVSSTPVPFGNLDFVITMEGELVRSSAATQPLLFTGLDAIAEVPEELQLPTTEVCAPGNNQPLSLDYGRPRTVDSVHEHLKLHRDTRDTPDTRIREAPLEQPDKDVPVHQAQQGSRTRTAVLVHERLGPHRDARDTLDARRHNAPSEQPNEDVLVHQA